MAHEHKVKIEDVATEGRKLILYDFYPFLSTVSLQMCLQTSI